MPQPYPELPPSNSRVFGRRARQNDPVFVVVIIPRWLPFLVIVAPRSGVDPISGYLSLGCGSFFRRGSDKSLTFEDTDSYLERRRRP